MLTTNGSFVSIYFLEEALFLLFVLVHQTIQNYYYYTTILVTYCYYTTNYYISPSRNRTLLIEEYYLTVLCLLRVAVLQRYCSSTLQSFHKLTLFTVVSLISD